MSEANKALIRRAFEHMNERDTSVIAELCPDCVYYSPAIGELRGETHKKPFTSLLSAFPDARWTVEDQLAEGDKVVTRYVMTGTHNGEFMGVAPTGRQITITGLCLDRIVEGKIVEEWDEWNALSMMRELGMAPTTNPKRIDPMATIRRLRTQVGPEPGQDMHQHAHAEANSSSHGSYSTGPHKPPVAAPVEEPKRAPRSDQPRDDPY